MKRYFARTAESDLGTGFVYFEFDGETATRQVEMYKDRWFYADNPKQYFDEIGPGLVDQPLSELELTADQEITKEEFEEAWEEALRYSS